jgi:N-acyl-L-homoserine lactone synthetase
MSPAQQPPQSAGGRALELLDRTDYRLIETPQDKEEIYRLRYRAYLREGTIDPNPAQAISDRFDDLPNSWIFGVYFDGALVSSLRISVSFPGQPETPSTEVFPDLLGPALAARKVMVDPTRFVAEPERAARFPELPYLTLRLAYVACSYFDADLGLASVRAEHRAFYRRVFLHEALGEPRVYPGLTKSICLMAVDYPRMRERVYSRYPVFRSSLFERRMLFERRLGHHASLVGPGFAQVERATVAW